MKHFVIFLCTMIACSASASYVDSPKQKAQVVLAEFRTKEKEKITIAPVVKEAEKKLADEGPGLVKSITDWENTAEDIRLKHGREQHVEGSPEAIYWRGKWEEATKTADSYRQRLGELQTNYDTSYARQLALAGEMGELSSEFLQLIRPYAGGQCASLLEAAEAVPPGDMTSMVLEKLWYCVSINWDGTKLGLPFIRGFVAVPGAFGTTNYVAITSEDEEAGRLKKTRIEEEMKKVKPKPKKPIVTEPPSVKSPPAQPSLSERLKKFIEDLRKSRYDVKNPPTGGVRGK